MNEAPLCAEVCRAVGEPLAGTASRDGLRFLLVERDEPWGPDALASTTLPGASREALIAAATARAGTRIVFVRPPGRAPSVPRLVVTGGPEGGSVAAIAGEHYTEADVLALLDGRSVAGASPIDVPIALVCTHGKRDRCCAKYGVALAHALASEPGILTFESSHLGGHRFAGVVVTLPDRFSYGHLDARDAPAFADSLRAGRIFDPPRFRGRAGTQEPVQVAEAQLALSGVPGAEHARFVRLEKRGEWVEVRFAIAEVEHLVLVRRVPHEALRPASCFEPPSPAVGQEARLADAPPAT